MGARNLLHHARLGSVQLEPIVVRDGDEEIHRATLSKNGVAVKLKKLSLAISKGTDVGDPLRSRPISARKAYGRQAR